VTLYRGVDFHARIQTASYRDAADGEIHQRDLRHQKGNIRSLCAQFSSEIIVVLESSGRTLECSGPYRHSTDS
jgi:hypothetical protein